MMRTELTLTATGWLTLKANPHEVSFPVDLMQYVDGEGDPVTWEDGWREGTVETIRKAHYARIKGEIFPRTFLLEDWDFEPQEEA